MFSSSLVSSAGSGSSTTAKPIVIGETSDLAGELETAKVTVNCSHPATFMNTAMVVHSGITPVSTLEQGGEATMRLITDPALDGVTGQFFDGLKTARARPEAYDPAFRARLREVTDRMLGNASSRPAS